MKTQPSLAGRALLAVGLMAGFYVLAISIAATLLYLPYAEWVYLDRIHLKLAFFCIAGAVIILWSIIPRLDRFDAPGPALTASEHPYLFKHLNEIAKATRQTLPAEVFLLPEMNAWVTNRGGIMGVGSRRVMGVGLPLLQILTVSQFRAVLAHEFGHYYGGDTKLGPWVYKTRAAMGRAIQGLGEHSSVLQKPFLWYGVGFLRITHAVSRRQEFAADALAASVSGAAPLIGGLKAVHGGAAAHVAYWQNEFLPVLNSGFRAPFVEGFGRFCELPQISAQLSNIVEKEVAEGEVDPYDTHPTLRDRMAALQHLPQDDPVASDPPAVSLLSNLSEMESRLITSLSHPNKPVEPIKWEDVGTKVWIPTWERQTKPYRTVLARTTLQRLPLLVQDLRDLSRRLAETDGLPLEPQERSERTVATLGCAVAVALHRHGWKVSALPGEEILFTHSGTTLNPFRLVGLMQAGELSTDAWRKQCDQVGIGDLHLAAITESGSVS